ncbi:MAG: type II toxin-antitoxin system VapB family antitoxin [Deltaproteobacteria bacterium]|jgi:hypothetical protein|nr:type II toxin-antitoxin system VapB family antitoxin [Deltaproteobacteria bacterium]MBW2537610.1 type II toxin-antitoxin system VapB family antitoxin [Deltaproteobacteria bacterium]
MRTTLHLDGVLVKNAKKRAALEGTTLAEVVQKALKDYLAAPSGAPSPRRIRLSVNHARFGSRRSR